MLREEGEEEREVESEIERALRRGRGRCARDERPRCESEGGVEGGEAVRGVIERRRGEEAVGEAEGGQRCG